MSTVCSELLSTSPEGPTLIQSVSDRYRCPEGFLDFSLSAELSTGSGYFQFGSQTCYGRSVKDAHQRQAKSPLYDALTNVSFDGMQLVLPFDPSEVIDNLRLE